jgi:CubicO group peptidase (beta-lactamase class C family)
MKMNPSQPKDGNHRYFHDFMAATADLRLHHIRLYRAGRLLDTADYRPLERQNQFSITKNIMALLCGFLYDRGLIHPDDRLADVFPDYIDRLSHPHWQQITLRHLLTMSSGQEGSHLMFDYRQAHPGEDYLQLAFSIDPVHPPGTFFEYSNIEPYLTGLWLDRLLNGELQSFAQQNLFSPLGIEAVTWEIDREGRIFGSSGLMLTTDELAKIGFLCLNEGVFEGQRLLSAEWVRAAVSDQIKTRQSGPDYCAYGWFFWRSDHESYRMSGKDGQILLNCPELQTTFVCNADEPQEKKILQAYWTHVHPLL